MNKKNTLSKLLNIILPIRALIYVRSFFYNEIIVLAYHRVCDVDKSKYKFDIELVSADTKEFEKQVKYVKANYNPVTMEQFTEYLENGNPLPDRAIMITFDDGFDDNYYCAYPILKKHNVPATIFVSTGYVSTDQTIWFDRLAALVFSVDDEVFIISEINKTYQLGKVKSARGKIMEKICEDLKLLPNEQRVTILERLNMQYHDAIKNIDYSVSQMLTWKQIKEMHQSVISIGSHTVTHPVLTKLNEEDLEFELRSSKQELEKQLNTEIESISYPNGNEDSYNENVIRKLKKIGYKLAFTYISGHNNIPAENRFALRRVHVENYIKIQRFKLICLLPSIFN